MNILNKIYSIFSKKNETLCEHDEHCPIYLSYLGKYNEGSPQLNNCKNANVQFCKKYRLYNEDEWKKLNKVDKMKIIKDMYLIDFVEKDKE